MRMFLRIRIVLIVIDRFANVVLPLIDLLTFRLGHMAAVRCTVRRDLVIDARFTALEICRLVGGKLARLDSLANALLLVFRPRPNS